MVFGDSWQGVVGGGGDVHCFLEGGSPSSSDIANEFLIQIYRVALNFIYLSLFGAIFIKVS